MKDIDEVAKELGRKLCGSVEHVVGVSIRRHEESQDLIVVVHINNEKARDSIPSIFEKYTIYYCITGTPIFATVG